ncbi:uncharacterized protein BP01DRAFT_424987 [Aspergillus saccharolyticus JOP 1030-1]|uniref:Tat pathway signal sequence n=1 Tax=Aspergillus saccharolyticus JOP 1030-1 TaxID=1450539 RepID=A0A318Z789_9EURO|nr:hypothetical protein BP01DRAFT_424987 [Aspergillus saccharolyticus JOP 1030-1]PYH43201.1 hypothetical protein BP01DRAFT_424987 [Aspergillus saccharolyticus JOP 1030-1]
MDLAAILSEPDKVDLTNHLAKIHYVAEQTARRVHRRGDQKNAPADPDLVLEWTAAQNDVRALYLERALELASLDQYRRAQVDHAEFATALYARCYAELDPNRAETALSIPTDVFGSSVQMLLSPESVPGSRSEQVEEEGTAVAVTSPVPAGATGRAVSEEQLYSIGDIRNQKIEALESAVAKGLKVLTILGKVFSGSEDWKTETDWIAEIEQTILKARTEKVVIGIVGSTGAGKSSLINALIDEKGVLTTDCMRASTAVPIEVSYNHGESRYKAEVQFIDHKDWERELKILFADLRDHSDELARDEKPKDPEAAVALDKIMAVYPNLKRRTLLETSPCKLLEDERVSDLLGQKIEIEDNHSKTFSEGLKSYIDSKGKKRGRPKVSSKNAASSARTELAGDEESADRGIGLWPLVRVVRVFVTSEALSTGAILVDLPGVFDSNAARVAVASEYMKQCSAHWIVAPINRAVDDKVAHDLLGKNFKTQMHMDGAFNDITFICTKTDDIVPAEVVRSLELDLPSMDEDMGACSEKLESLRSELQVHEELQRQIHSKCYAIYEEVCELEEKGSNLAEPVRTPQRRKRTNFGEATPEASVSNMTLSDNIEGEDEDELQELRRQLRKLKTQRKDLDNQRRNIEQYIAKTKEEIELLGIKKQNSEFNDLRFCIEARNEFSKSEIKRDFAQTIADLDLEDEQSSGSMPQTPHRRDYSELERNLSVFCVSPRAYQALRGRPEVETRVRGFSHLEQTEIPALQRYCVALTCKARESVARRFLVALNLLLQSMTLWSSAAAEVAAISEPKRLEIEAEFNGAMKKFTDTMKKVRNRVISVSRIIIQDMVIEKLDQAWQHGYEELSPMVAGWNGAADKPGFRYNTYQAICRRQGIYKQHNINNDVALLVVAKFKPGWRKAFLRMLPELFKQLCEDAEDALGHFHSEAIHSAQWELPRATRQQLQCGLVILHASMRDQVQQLQDWTKTAARKVKDRFEESVAAGLQETYEACVQHRGKY